MHIADQIGFNIGAAGQPPRCRNSLHTHRTAEVFFVLSGRWRFFWGRWGTAGEVTLEAGDIFNIPTHMFRGFENIGDDYGMIMAILGGNDAGGGVFWAPQVIQDAQAHGLVLGDNGKLYDSKQGVALPEGVSPMQVLDDAALAEFPEPTTAEVVPRFWDMVALSDHQPVEVIGPEALLRDKPGFEVDFLSRESLSGPTSSDRNQVIMPVKGHWRLSWDGGTTVLNPGDTCALPPGLSHSLAPSMTGTVGCYRIRDTDDAPGRTWGI